MESGVGKAAAANPCEGSATSGRCRERKGVGGVKIRSGLAIQSAGI